MSLVNIGARARVAVVVAWLTVAAAVCRADVAVKVEGLEGPLKTNVELVLSIGRASADVGAGRVRRLHARAPDGIRKGLEPFGYYSPRITTNLEADGENWRATYVVDPGPRTHVATVDARVIGPGSDDPGFRQILRDFPMQVGDPLEHAAYELGKRQLLGYAARKGYFDVSLDSTAILVTAGDATADVVGEFEAGGAGARPNQEALFRGSFALPDYRSYRDSLPTQPVTGNLTGTIPDLGFFNGLDARVRDVHGAVALVVDVAGTVAEPDVAVNLQVDDTGVALPDLGLVVATIHGDSFQLMNTPEVQAEASPDIEIVYDMEKLTVQGAVTLSRVLVELVEMPEMAVAPSADAVVVDSEEPPPVLPADTWVDMQIVLGDEIVFRGFAFSVQLAGALHIRQHVPEPPTGNGDITITEGFYRAYGQNLTIENGVISFAGPVENPAQNVTAYRETPDGIIAGVVVTGTAEHPELKIYSDPVMQETEAISYLLTGRPLDAGSGDDKAKVASTAALRGSNVLSSQLGSKIGLDEARVETGGELDEAALVTGKYLSPRVYLSYAMGLFDRSNLVRVRYIFNRKWAVQAETGTTMGSDLFYKIERGGK